MSFGFSIPAALASQLLALADAIGPHICVLKTHVDVLSDFAYEAVVPQLQALAQANKLHTQHAAHSTHTHTQHAM